MKIIVPLLAAIISGSLVFTVMQQRTKGCNRASGMQELERIRQMVENRFEEIAKDLDENVGAFAGVISTDRDFSLKLFVENDRSAPEITEMAVSFRKPMGLSLLEIADSSNVLLSSGHFPASAGNSIAKKMVELSDSPILIDDNIMGTSTLTLQTCKEFKIADLPFNALGGYVIDNQFLQKLSPHQEVRILLKRGDAYAGMENIKSISALKDSRIIINDKEYPAAQIDLPYAGEGEVPALIIVVQK